MAARGFGNTWWGAQWLQSLEHIDCSNRLPRGARYARNGSVRNIATNGGTVTASVSGSQPRPYGVKIEVPQFDKKASRQFVAELSRRPVLMAELLGRRLDPTVLDIAEACGLDVFPRSWKDLGMRCSCPDWAVPCKHIAAVIYLLANEIDNNPFLVFSLHGLDLLKELSAGATQRHELTTTVATVSDMVSPADEDVANEHPEINDESHGTARQAFRGLDLTRVPECGALQTLLLPEKPQFMARGDFKSAYLTSLSRLAAVAEKYFAAGGFRKLFADIAEAMPCEGQPPLGRDRSFSLSFDSMLSPTLHNLAKGYGEDRATTYTLWQLFGAVQPISTDFLPDYHPSVAVLHQAFALSLRLIARQAVCPVLVAVPARGKSRRHYAVIWEALGTVPEVSALISQLDAAVPAETVTLRPTPRSRTRLVSEQGLWLLRVVLTLIVRTLAKSQLPAALRGDDLTGLFFLGDTNDFDAPGEREIPGAIAAWTHSLKPRQWDFTPVLRVDESDENVFSLDIDIEAGDTVTPLAEVLTAEPWASRRMAIVSALVSLSQMVPDIAPYVDGGARDAVRYVGDEQFVRFLTDSVPAMRLMHIKVMLPRSLGQIIRPKPTVAIDRQDTADSVSRLSIDELFRFSWDVALGDVVVSVDEFQPYMRRAGELVKLRGRYVYMDADALTALQKALERPAQMSGIAALQVALTGTYEGAPVTLTPAARELLSTLHDTEPVAVPTTLCATLRPYQLRGYSWLYRNLRLGFGSILADDMGLGKTVQTIALFLRMKEEKWIDEGRVLLVVPTGLLTNWLSELHRFAPSLTVMLYHGQARTLKGFDADILLTTYGTLRSDGARLRRLPWRLTVIDEAQNIKTPAAAQTKAVKATGAKTCIALSGTPVENRLSEFWSIMDFANTGYLGGLKTFNKIYSSPIQKLGDTAAAERFRQVTAPFMLRRVKTDKAIISDLPDKIEMNEQAALTPEQAALYTHTLNEAMATIKGLDTTDSAQLFKRQGLVLQMITALKQICDHPALFTKQQGATHTAATLSGKAEMLKERIASVVEAGEKALVFTQYTAMAELLCAFIAEATGRQPLYLHGGCTIRQRQEMVERFQTSHSDQIFVLSLKAAGTGLNLTAATHVFHYDLWWNPAVENQATDRAYRIGQEQRVVVHRFITTGTFEERIDAMMADKRRLADMTVATGETWLGRLSNKELEALFA